MLEIIIIDNQATSILQLFPKKVNLSAFYEKSVHKAFASSELTIQKNQIYETSFNIWQRVALL
jgi:hypothetical protein